MADVDSLVAELQRELARREARMLELEGQVQQSRRETAELAAKLEAVRLAVARRDLGAAERDRANMVEVQSLAAGHGHAVEKWSGLMATPVSHGVETQEQEAVRMQAYEAAEELRKRDHARGDVQERGGFDHLDSLERERQDLKRSLGESYMRGATEEERIQIAIKIQKVEAQQMRHPDFSKYPGLGRRG